jgi:hypothetical protein
MGHFIKLNNFFISEVDKQAPKEAWGLQDRLKIWLPDKISHNSYAALCKAIIAYYQGKINQIELGIALRKAQGR